MTILAGDVTIEDVPLAMTVALVDIEVEKPKLIVLRGANLVFEIVPRICKNANRLE